ncbi:Hsp20/alpha crystallin family protein [Extensimonas vulgaris]|uniref:HSP20 family molecular chaperone IbpA n=1 Tax=Extensimonas vulgaris TaxID=1031594 RepID=A0A369ALX1_9BURK|nr:Hsp20/alpha crystallin family protein [Extensimonas vulgaris]RCX10075.1 HSP20 family molecular chaperone IbpA [Extensimonas vulgaris]TWI36528.1 HSP20 family molecular chaperone IbpA [Extensimonas vulgaris]TXD17229.1 Hsp20/alpha crystallin family protein [Extensimonas vulgaris]
MSENKVTQTAPNAVNKAADKAQEDFTLQPAVDVIEDAGGITLYADLPGVPKDKLNLQIESDTLTIEGEVALDIPQDMEASHVEVGLPRYRRVFTLSKELDPAKTQAKFDQGVLSLRIPKAEHAQPRRIEVQVA